MVKINKEEYWFLKGLNDVWKWIAKDKNTTLWVYKKEPSKYEDCWDEFMDACEMIDSVLFQFIQWEDEEPYNIQELIEDYEDKEFYDYVGREYHKSEETEMKKDLEWAKHQIDLRDTGTTDKDDPQFYVDAGLRMALDFLDQLDEPEVKKLERKIEELDSYNDELIRDNNQLRNELDKQESLSRAFIDEKAVEVYVDTADAELHVVFRMEDLQNLLVPKQELPVIPSYVAEWIEKYIEYGYDLYPSLKKMENNSRSWKKTYDWYRKNTRKFVNAYLTGIYEVEEEPLYRARLKVITNEFIASYLRTQSSDAEDRLKTLEIGSMHIHEDYRHLSEFTEVELKRLNIWDSEQWEVEEVEENGKD